MRFVYTLVLRLALPFVLARLWWRGRREPGYRERIAERFGRYTLAAPEKLLWIHAVSVGEARAAAPLVQALKRALPDHAILMTCMTAAGRETLRQVYGDSVLRVWLPYDYPAAVRRFLEHFRPRAGVIMETEMWPNLLAACASRGVPMLLANARMSEKSARGYALGAAVTGEGIRSFAAVCAQSETDAARLRSLGAPNVRVSGNLKFEVPPDPAQAEAGKRWRAGLARPVLLLASTRDPEERLLLEAFGRVDLGPALTVIVPRHPQRFDAVAPLADSRRTIEEVPSKESRIHLGDTMGEMPFYYSAADVALICGSFAPLGGQNLIEALALGVPVVVGPSMFNFAEATKLAVQAGAALQAADAAEAARLCAGLLADGGTRAAMAAAGKKLADGSRGAADRHLAAVLELLRG